MVDKERLKTLIAESGISKELIAGSIGISITSLNNKISQRTGFYLEEAVKISKLLKIDRDTMFDVFFKDDVGNEPTEEERA